MSSKHCMAHKLRLPLPSSTNPRNSITVLLICYMASVVHAKSLPQDTWSIPNDGGRNQTLIIMNDNQDVTSIRREFTDFLNTFNITVTEDVEFLRGDGLNTLLRQAQNANYSTVIYVLHGNDSGDAGYCDMSGPLSQTYNKSIIFWPCFKMKRTVKFLPSLETISFAVKSISQEFNWTEAVIFVAGTDWGLPLAVAANLKFPYRIEYNYANAEQIDDKLGTAVIVTSPMNSHETKRLLHDFRRFFYTKVLVIDMTGSIFSRQNQFAGYLSTKEELDYIFEHWSENNYYSSSSSPSKESGGHGNATKTRIERSTSDYETATQTTTTRAQAQKERDRSVGNENVEQSVVKGRNVNGVGGAVEFGEAFIESVSSSFSKMIPIRFHQKLVVDPKPQNFLILTVLTEKFKTFHNTALHVEFDQYYMLSRSGIVEPFRRSSAQSTATNEGAIVSTRDNKGSVEGDADDRSKNNGDTSGRYQLQQRRQIKRSEEIIVTVNGTRNCKTDSKDKHANVTGAAGVGNDPKSGDDCAEEEEEKKKKNNRDNGKDEVGRLLISKLPIFTSLTSSINESIQLLLGYMERQNCTLSISNDTSALWKCGNALKCATVIDANEQLFCNYLCQLMVNYVKPNFHRISNSNQSSSRVYEILPDYDPSPRRFSNESEVVVALEQICRRGKQNGSTGGRGIQMQFSENLLYFYNENAVVSKNNELVKRHKSKAMPNQNLQLRYPEAAKDSSSLRRPAAQTGAHRVSKRNQISPSVPATGVHKSTEGDDLKRPGYRTVDKRDIADDPNSKVTGAHRNEFATAASHYAKYSEYFSLFDYIVAPADDHLDTDDIQTDFIILDFQSIITSTANESGMGWRPFLIMQQSPVNRQIFTIHSVLPGYNDWTFVPTSDFMDCGILCIGVIVLAVIILSSIVVGGIISAITIRNYLLKKRLSKGPNKVVLSPVDFVFPVDSRRVDEGIEAMLCCFLQQLQEFGGPEVDKPDVTKGSIGSLKNVSVSTAQHKNASGSGSLVRHNTVLDMRARYNGDLVQLKEVSMLTGMELKTKAMDLLVSSHGLRHENINPFIGWLSDSNRTAMVFEYCSRGSLQDVLIMDDIKLDWSFRLSLLTDLVRGMRYLHSSPLRVHGGLTSRNCVVDARWVLKITDYGMSSFYDAIGVTPPTKSAKELLWTAPEALRSTKGFPKCGTQMGDVYSFGIIMQEVVVRGEPYCMLSLSPEEIISKIKKPPPLIRPSVSKGAAPPEAINIMRQCWAEMPDMRPDFNTVYERFKQLNHGRKVNFVDTMFQMLEKYSNNLEELIRERTEQLDMERKKTEQLLNRMLPNTVAEKLKVGLGVEPEEFSEVTIYFSDIVGFTTIAAHCSPVQVVDLLNDLYTCFDATINAYDVYKVETIGDAYMVVSGLPSRIPDHAEQIATMALDLLHESGRFQVKHLPGVPLQLRIGLHSGPCCAGVVGLTMPRYCLFGDTVNTASRMESTGSSWRIHLSQSTRDRLERAGGYYIDPRGLIEIKGKGMMNTYWLLGKKGFDKPLPVPPPIGESHGLDESLIRNSIQSSQVIEQISSEDDLTIESAIALRPDSVEVTVEITPPAMTYVELQQHPLSSVADRSPQMIATSMSLDSNASGANTISYSHQDFPPRASVSAASPQQRKMSEFSQDSLLNPIGFTRMTPSPGANSSRLFKKIEEMMDLSSPYNHYRCLSPSESNLVQCGNNILNLGTTLQNLATLGGNLSVPSPAMHMMNTFQNLMVPDQQQTDGGKLNSTRSTNAAAIVTESLSKPGSGRLLRRQFSLDKDDVNNNSANRTTLSNNLGNSACRHAGMATAASAGGGGKSHSESVPPPDTYQKHSSLPSISGQTLINKLHQTTNPRTALFKHNSSSISQDLEKIEEIPGSPVNHPLAYSGQTRSNHAAVGGGGSGAFSQSSTSSIPFIDGSSCSSSVSTIPPTTGNLGTPIPESIVGEGKSPGDRREINLNSDRIMLR